MNTYDEISFGGINLGGSADVFYVKGSYDGNIVYSITASGGVSNSGFAPESLIYNIGSQGTTLIGGSGSESLIYNIGSQGTILIGGFSPASLINVIVTVGEIKLSGDVIATDAIIATGGVTTFISSLSSFLYNHVSIGGVKLYANFDNTKFTEFFVESGGLLFQGTALIRVRYRNNFEGLCFVSGDFFVSESFVSLGGAVCSSSSNFNLVMKEVRGSIVGGLKPSGKNLLNVNNNFFVTPSGSISVEGSGFYFINDTLFVSGGGLSLKSDGTLINFKFNKDIEFKWNTDLKLEKKVDFYWNLGQQIMYWYRVIGKGIVDPCIPQDVCCGKIIVNLHARSLSELCQKLSKRKYKFPIDTVERFNRPAETVVVEEQESNGVNLDCNNLVDVELCSIPECADFCVDQDINLKTGFYFKAWIVFQSTASGNLQTSGESSYVFVKKLPNIKFKSEGELFFDGNFIIGTNFFRGRGGCVVGGKSRLRHNRWSYNGGVWPNKTPKSYAKKSTSIKHIPTQSPWLLPERAISEDNLFSSSDISFKKTSELLVLTNFSFDIPEGSKVLKLIVNVDRVATKSGIRDKDLFLVINNKVITSNLAVTSIDWPLLQTTKSYGSDAWRREDFDRYVDESSLINLNINNQPGEVPSVPSLEEIKNSSFGVAIRVQSVLNINQTIARINSINIEVEYEDPNGSTIRVSSNSGASAKSPAYTSKSLGKIYSYGSANARYTKRTVFKVSSFGAKIGGDSLKTIFENTGGGCLLSSSSKITPYLENPIINLKLGGESFVLPWWHSMSGGLKIRGSASRFERFKYQVFGGINIAGESFVPRKISKYFAAGGVNLLGSARSKKQNWKWISDGNAVFVIGQAVNKSGNVSVPNQIFDFSMNLLKMDVYFASIDKQDAEGDVDFFNKCGCFDLSSTMTLTHNFAIDNVFAKFLTRNNFTISKNLELRYNKTNDSWQNNLHYKGISGLGNYLESWNVVSEVSCLNNIGGTVLGSKVWKVALQFSRNNLLTGDSYETRIVVAVLPDDYCLTAANRLEFEINYDTQSNFAVSNPAATIYQNTIYDNIGIFKNRAWIESPDLILKVTQSLAETSRKRVRMPTSTLSE